MYGWAIGGTAPTAKKSKGDRLKKMERKKKHNKRSQHRFVADVGEAAGAKQKKENPERSFKARAVEKGTDRCT